MAANIKSNTTGLRLEPFSSATINLQGEFQVLSSTGKFYYHNGTTSSPGVTEAHSATLTNKSIDADTNTITNIENADIKALAAIDATKIANGSVSNTEFQYLDGVTSGIQGQINALGSVTAGVVGRLALYPASAASVDDIYTQNAFAIDLLIAPQATRSAALTYTIPNPGDAVTAASFVLTEGAQTINGAKTFGSNMVVNGNLTVNGTTTTVNTTNLEVTDKNILLNDGGAASSGDGSGFEIEENAIVTGYVKIGNTRASLDVKAPASSGVFRLTPSTAAFTGAIAFGTLTASRVYTIPELTGDFTFAMTAGTQTFTGKSIDADTNTITNIENADIKAAAAIDATKIADGSVTSTEFQYINTLSSNAQTQISAKLTDPMTTNEDIIIRRAGAATRLAVGTESQVLTVVSGALAWATPAAGGGSSTTSGEGSFVQNFQVTPEVFILQSPNTTKWTVSVDNSGVLSTTSGATGTVDDYKITRTDATEVSFSIDNTGTLSVVNPSTGTTLKTIYLQSPNGTNWQLKCDNSDTLYTESLGLASFQVKKTSSIPVFAIQEETVGGIVHVFKYTSGNLPAVPTAITGCIATAMYDTGAAIRQIYYDTYASAWKYTHDNTNV